MATKTRHDFDAFLSRFVFITSFVTVLILVMIYVSNPNIVTGVSALVGVAIPLFWAYSADTLKENKSIEGYVKWCEVITNSNLTTIRNDLLPWLVSMKNTNNFEKFRYSDIEKAHGLLRKNLDVRAYIELLNSGLYYKLENDFQETLFYLVELITKAEIIYSIHELRLERFRSDPRILRMQSNMAGDQIKKIFRDLITRLNEIENHLEKLKKYIVKYKKDFKLPEPKKKKS